MLEQELLGLPARGVASEVESQVCLAAAAQCAWGQISACWEPSTCMLGHAMLPAAGLQAMFWRRGAAPSAGSADRRRCGWHHQGGAPNRMGIAWLLQRATSWCTRQCHSGPFLHLSLAILPCHPVPRSSTSVMASPPARRSSAHCPYPGRHRQTTGTISRAPSMTSPPYRCKDQGISWGGTGICPWPPCCFIAPAPPLAAAACRGKAVHCHCNQQGCQSHHACLHRRHCHQLDVSRGSARCHAHCAPPHYPRTYTFVCACSSRTCMQRQSCTMPLQPSWAPALGCTTCTTVTA